MSQVPPPAAAVDGDVSVTKKIALSDHYRKLVKPDTNKKDLYFSYRYFHQNHLFHVKKGTIDKIKAKLLEASPRPRITAFNQGSVHFPYDKREEVLQTIAWDVQTNSTMYWNQLAYDVPGEGFRLVIDLDSDSRVLNEDEIFRLAHVLWKTLREYYADFETNPIDIFICKCGPRLKKGQLSVGVHIIAHVQVSCVQAKQIIYGYNLRLKTDLSVNLKGLTIDDSIYKLDSGMCSTRMIYCNKVEDCPVCDNVTEHRQTCKFCEKLGEVISRSTYIPSAVLDSRTGLPNDDLFYQRNNSHLQMVKNYSIWPEEADRTHVYAKPPTDPMYAPLADGAGGGTGKKSSSAAGRPAKRMKPSRSDDHELLTEFLHQLVWKEKRWWKGIEISKVALTENENMAWIYVTGLGSTMCPYAMKDHGDNRIWFTLSRRGRLTVYCHSQKVEYGCKSQDRVTFDVPGSIVQEIFGVVAHPPFNMKEAKEFDFDNFVKRVETTTYKAKDTALTRQEKEMDRLAQAYDISYVKQPH